MVALVPACEPSSPPDLAMLESLSPGEIEPGEELTLTGSGFVVGRAELILEGTLSSPGRAPSRSHRERLELSVLATSPSTASARLGRRHFQQLEAAHTTFIGRATLRFPSAAGSNAPAITASLENVRLELFAGPNAHRASAHETRRRGRQVLSELGVEAGALPEARGLLVRRVAPNSIADRAGLGAGEIIVSSGALTVASPADLAPPPGDRRLVLGVRDDQGQFRRVACRIHHPGAGEDTERIAAFSIGGCALLLLLVVAGPLRGSFRLLRRLVAGQGDGPRQLWASLANDSRSRPTTTAVSLMLFAAAPFAVMALASAGVVVVAGLVLLISLVEAISSRRGWRRLTAIGIGLARALPLALAATVAAAQAASIDLGDVARAQGLSPWEWTALSDPASLLLLVLVMTVSCSGFERQWKPAPALQRGLVSALTAAVLLGGWTMGPEQQLLGQLLFALKSWAIGTLITGGTPGRALASMLLAVAAAAAALALTVLEHPDWVMTAASWSAGAAAVFWVLPWWAAVLGRPPRHLDEAPGTPPARAEPSPALTLSSAPLHDPSV